MSEIAAPQQDTYPSKVHAFKKGQSGNPAGSKTAGAIITNHLNALSALNLTVEQVREIANDKKEGIPRRAAAKRLLGMMEAGDLADFEEVMDGKERLSEARKRGINTEVVRKIKVKTKTIPTDKGDITEVNREIELFDRAGQDFDRVMDRTHGKPVQAIVGANGGPVQVQAVTLDYSKLSPEELETLLALTTKATPPAMPSPLPELGGDA